MKALVVNCSGYYNLGALKLTDWMRAAGYDVTYSKGDPGLFAYGYDLVALSVIFSWEAPLAADIALRVKSHADVWCGGPGITFLRKWFFEHVGIEAHSGFDQRFEHQRGNYIYTFASRGCPVDCYFCIVPKLEGVDFTLDWDFQPAPVLCDNNLSALPDVFQEHIIRRYREADVSLKDANSGFEPRTFTEETYQRWKPILRGPWRFAFDTTSEEQYVQPMMRTLADVPSSRKRVYVLIGNEPFAACYERAQKVIEWGGEPFCQPLIPLNALSRGHLKVAYDWTNQRLKDFARYYNRFLWRKITLADYKPRKRELAPFSSI